VTVAQPSAESPLIEAARAWYDAGFCVIPSHEDGGKRPFGRWKEYQHARPDWETLHAWLSTGRYTGIGVICGVASGNVEMLEIEGPQEPLALRLEAVIALAETMQLAGLKELLARVIHGCAELSAGGGIHVFIRVVDGPAKGNTKLAMDGEKVLAETRGEGGFVIVAPTSARRGHADGAVYMLLTDASPAAVAEVTAEERDMLHLLLNLALDQAATVVESAPEPVAPTVVALSPARPATGLSAFDDYRARVTWRDILEPAGWIYSHHGDDGHDYWVRPGKDPREGHSASTIEDGPFWCFSSSTDFPIEVAMSKGQVYAHLSHGGDLSAAARHLALSGYGTPPVDYATPAAWNPEAAIPADFWTAHPVLTEVRQAAHSRMVSADAVLGCALARVAQHIPWQYKIPPIIGGRSTPNLFVALIGPSGTGKGGARRAADDYLGTIPREGNHPVTEGPLGSGEGIVSLFYDFPPADRDDPDSKPGKSLEFAYRGVLVLDEEGSALAELIKRQGQVTEQTLLKMWSGERLGFSYSARASGLRLNVEDGQYRGAALLGIQPAAASFLLAEDRQDRGLPQRFLWASTIDPSVPSPRDLPEWPSARPWRPPRFDNRHGLDVDYVAVDDSVREELREAHHARVTGTGSLGLESHAGLVRLKTATALGALLNPGERLAVTPFLWDLAATLQSSSDLVREAVARKAQDAQKAASESRKVAAVQQRIAVQEADDTVLNCARTIAKHVAKHSEEVEHCTRKCLRGSLQSGYRDRYEAAIAKAMALEWITETHESEGDVARYSMGAGRPA